MKNLTILPADSYIVINKTTITDADRKLISMLYQPIIGYTAVSLYNTLIEIPTQYAAYGYGMSFMLDLHVDAKARLGYLYDEVEFNAMLLSKGWVGFDILEDTYEEYMKAKCFELGIEYK